MQDTYRTSIGHISHYQQAPLKKVDTSAGELHIYISPFKSYLIVMSSSFKYKKQKMQSRNRRVHTSFLTVYLQRNCSSETCELRHSVSQTEVMAQFISFSEELWTWILFVEMSWVWVFCTRATTSFSVTREESLRSFYSAILKCIKLDTSSG